MYRDLVAGERVEADQILGDLRARARRAGLATPLVSAAFVQLDAYQRRRAANCAAGAPATAAATTA
jgi:2-dehydropantoate 2-reductase